MSRGRPFCVAALAILWPVVTVAQSSFEPLNRWKTALESGNEASLAALYARVPPAQTQTPEGTVQDPEAEPRFWSAVVAKGPSSLNPKLLATEQRQGGLVEAVLRIEVTLKTSSGNEPYVAAVHQLWQRQGSDWFIVFTRRGDLDPNPPRRLPEPATPKTDLYAAPEDAPGEISAALATAAKDHKRVILVFGANWCYDCHVLDAAFHSKAISPLVNANYHVVHINVGDGDRNLELADRYGVPLRKAVRVPSLAVLDSSGKVVYSQQNGEFDNTERFGPADVTAFLKKWAPPRG